MTTWTKEPPKEAGWYFWKRTNPRCSLNVVEVHEWDDGRLWANHCGEEGGYTLPDGNLSNALWWRIEEPK